jgi:hypothetical protein
MGVIILSHLISIIFAFIFWFFPGWVLLGKENNKPFLLKVFLSLSLGFSFYALLIYLLRILRLPIWFGYVPGILSVIYLQKNIQMFKIINKFSSHYLILLVIIISSFLIQGSVLYRSGIQNQNGISFVELSAHDSLQHLYLINELQINFPPRHPGFSPSLVKNYHILMDVVLSSMNQYFPISTYELYYRFFPAFISCLSSLGIFLFVRSKTHNFSLSTFAVIFMNTSGNVAWILQKIMHNRFEAHANTFMLDPYIDLLQNPISMLVFPLILSGIFCLEILEKRFSLRWLLYASLLFGVVIGFKAWAGVIVALALICSAALSSVLKHNHSLWLVFIATAIVMSIVMLPVFDAKTAATPIFIPGWLLKHMMEDKDRLNDLSNYFLEQTYQYENNYFRLILLYTKQVILFIIGNLWLKIFGIFAIIKLIKKPHIWVIFSLSASCFSLVIPLLFNQGRMAYDIIQFGPYFLFFMGIFFILTLHELVKKQNKYFAWFVLLLVLLLSFPSNWNSVKNRTKADSFLVSSQEIEMYEYIKKYTNTDSNLMVYPSSRNDSILLVAALSGRPTYFSGKSFSIITGEEMQTRKQKWLDFFHQVDVEKRKTVIEEGRVDYLLLSNEESVKFNPHGIDIELVFSNSTANLYKID